MQNYFNFLQRFKKKNFLCYLFSNGDVLFVLPCVFNFCFFGFERKRKGQKEREKNLRNREHGVWITMLNSSYTKKNFFFPKIRKELRNWSRNNSLYEVKEMFILGEKERNVSINSILRCKNLRKQKNIQTIWYVLICSGWDFRCNSSDMNVLKL